MAHEEANGPAEPAGPEKTVVRYFVSYAHDDKELATRLLNDVEQFMSAHPRYRFVKWQDTDIELGENWQQRINDAIADCHFGLLLVSISFLTSEFIKTCELPRFVTEDLNVTPDRRAAPIMLEAIDDTNDTIDWRGLKSIQRFYDGKHRAYADCVNAKLKKKFANQLYSKIGSMIDNAPPDFWGKKNSNGSSSENGTGGSDRSNGSKHVRLTLELLGVDGARPLVRALLVRISKNHQDCRDFSGSEDLVQWLAKSPLPTNALEHLFFALNGSLDDVNKTVPKNDPCRANVEDAAAALYCLIAIRLVDQTAHEAGRYLVRVPQTENMICAVITTALFGGKIELKLADDVYKTVYDHVYPIELTASGHEIYHEFARAAFVALLPNHPDTPNVSADSGRLTKDQEDALKVVIENFTFGLEKSLALTINEAPDSVAIGNFANDLSVPVLLPDDMASTLLRIDASRLKGYLHTFLQGLDELRRKQ